MEPMFFLFLNFSIAETNSFKKHDPAFIGGGVKIFSQKHGFRHLFFVFSKGFIYCFMIKISPEVLSA